MKVQNQHGAEFDCTTIGDLWHIAMKLPDPQQEMVLDVWHQAHAMRHTLAAIRRKASDWGAMDIDETLEFLQAIADGSEV